MTFKMKNKCKIHRVLLGAEKRSELFTVLVKNVLGHSSAKNVCKKDPFLLKEIGEKGHLSTLFCSVICPGEQKKY